MSKPEDKQSARETAERSEVEEKKQTLLYHLNALRQGLGGQRRGGADRLCGHFLWLH